MKALQIPPDALDNSQVDELALGHFVTARTFILLHEMGHILYGHDARTFADSVNNERQADQFAAAVMQRTALPPLGMIIFFLADAHYSFGLGIGLIDGEIVGQKLYFNWEWAGNYGRGVLQVRSDGSFTGTWGYREARDGAGTWTGRRGQ